MFTISSFKSIEDKHDIYRGKDYLKKFCESLREDAMKIINFKKKKNEVIKKKAGKIIRKCQNLSHLERKIWKKIFERSKILESQRSLTLHREI